MTQVLHFALRLRARPIGLLFGVTSSVALLGYLLTLEPDISWRFNSGDGGELITAAATLGIPHPPGYPTFVLLGYLFSRIPIGAVAFRLNLMSAVFAALAAGFTSAAVLVFHLNSERRISPSAWFAALAAGLMLAFAPLVWGQAIVTEVYALNLAVTAAFICTLGRVKAAVPKRVQTASIVSGILLGLAVTTHLTSLFLLPLGVTFVPRHRRLTLLAGFLAGLVPFLLFPFFAQNNRPLVWGEPQNLRGWLWLVGARVYRPNVLALPPVLWWRRVTAWLPVIVSQLSWLALPATVIALRRPSADRKLLAMLSGTAILYLAYAFLYNTPDALSQTLPAILLLSVVLGILAARFAWPLLFLPGLLVALNFSQMAQGKGLDVRTEVSRLAGEMPPRSLVVTRGDQTVAALWYFHFIEGWRSDIALVDGNMFQFDWYRARTGRQYPDLTHLQEDDLDRFRASNGRLRPVCDVSLVEPKIRECVRPVYEVGVKRNDRKGS